MGNLRRVPPLLCRKQALGDYLLRGLGGIRDEQRQLFPLSSPEVPQHELCRVHSPRRPADSDADAVVVARPKKALDQRSFGPGSSSMSTARLLGSTDV